MMINNIVVVGSGVMGRGIAYVGALGGFDFRLYDVNESALENAKKEIDTIFEKGCHAENHCRTGGIRKV